MRATRRAAAAGALVAALALGPAPAAAELPPPSRLVWVAPGGGSAHSLTLEFAAVAVLGADRLTGYPELGRLFGGEPEMIRLRVGGVGDFGSAGYAVRVDVAESLRIDAETLELFPLVAVNRVIDDLFALWRPVPELAVTAGRQRVGVSRFRDVEPSLIAAGIAPFAIDRAFPDRRWGARARLRWGKLTAGAGAWADGDRLEPRTVPGDPAFGSRALASAELGFAFLGGAADHWLPRRPPPESEDDEVGTGSLEEVPPWPEPRLAARIAPLVRVGDRTRLDAVAGLEASWRRYGALAELLWQDGDLGAALEGEAVVHPRASVFLRGELDGERRLWSSGAGITYFATDDRRNRIAFYGWVRRDFDDAPARDGVVLQLQANL